jgi:hypothetical protein
VSIHNQQTIRIAVPSVSDAVIKGHKTWEYTITGIEGVRVHQSTIVEEQRIDAIRNREVLSRIINNTTARLDRIIRRGQQRKSNTTQKSD